MSAISLHKVLLSIVYVFKQLLVFWGLNQNYFPLNQEIYLRSYRQYYWSFGFDTNLFWITHRLNIKNFRKYLTYHWWPLTRFSLYPWISSFSAHNDGLSRSIYLGDKINIWSILFWIRAMTCVQPNILIQVILAPKEKKIFVIKYLF